MAQHKHQSALTRSIPTKPNGVSLVAGHLATLQGGAAPQCSFTASLERGHSPAFNQQRLASLRPKVFLSGGAHHSPLSPAPCGARVGVLGRRRIGREKGVLERLEDAVCGTRVDVLLDQGGCPNLSSQTGGLEDPNPKFGENLRVGWDRE